jgi:hypothetical protein
MPRRSFSGLTYFSFEQTEMAMKATWINEWLDAGKAVVGLLARAEDGGPKEYGQIEEAIQPRTDTIECRMADGTIRTIYGYKMETPP